MYCDDSSVKPVDPKQVVVRNILYFLRLSLIRKRYEYRAKRHMFCSTNEHDLKVQISYSIFFLSAPIYFCTCL